MSHPQFLLDHFEKDNRAGVTTPKGSVMVHANHERQQMYARAVKGAESQDFYGDNLFNEAERWLNS